jgi:peptidyl-tRNA hydrolase
MPEEFNPKDTPEEIEKHKSQEDPWVLYLVVRESLGMSIGKTAAQAGHAVGMIYEKLEVYRKNFDYLEVKYGECVKQTLNEIGAKLSSFYSWQESSYRKVVLRASDQEWEKLKAELECFVVHDAGLTEIEPGETAIGLWPMKKSQRPKIIKRLQVLK